MRKEASLAEWKALYEIATELKELRPWESFWDMDLIQLQGEEEEDVAFVSILGKGGDCYGITVYEGYDGLNDFMRLALADEMNLSVEFAMFSQNNLTCYWGNREELSEKQRKTIKELGYKYRGKSQWLYFMSYQAGYFPYNLDEDEVRRRTRYLGLLLEAVQCYRDMEEVVDFKGGDLFCYAFNEKTGARKWGAQAMPFTSCQFPSLTLTEEELLRELKEASKNDCILEAECTYTGSAVTDKKYDRPANPMLCLLAERNSGMMLKAEMVGPDEDAMVVLAETVVGFILTHGAPKEIRVSNVIIEAILDQVCQVAGIRLRRVKKLSAVSEFWEGMRERF